MRVLDEGPGVPESERDSIFRRFWRRDRHESGGRGRGIGLAIVARVAETHGGSITVENRRGGGATFTAAPATGGRLDRRKLTVAG